jgi:hypothetical protein
MAARITWFYETQLRHLNLEGFQAARPDKPGLALELVSEEAPPAVVPGQFGQVPGGGRVYRDSRRPMWTDDDAARHDAFAASLIGRFADFLSEKEPHQLAAGLAALKQDHETGAYGSVTDPLGVLSGLPRPAPDDRMGMAISRAELAAAKPWLIPELYNTVEPDAKDPRKWLGNLEAYVADFEAELRLSLGAAAPAVPLDPDAPAPYRGALASMLTGISSRRVGDTVSVRLLELRKDKPEDAEEKYFYQLSLATASSAMGQVEDFSLSSRTKYWAKVFHDPLRECLVLKSESDMGQCLLVRMCYRYGPLPAGLGTDADLTWRRRKGPDETFTQFLADRATALGDDAEAQRRLLVAGTKLRIILEESAAHPRGPDPSFSPLAGEILKQGLLSAKFWLDEKPRAKDNDRLNKLKSDLCYGDQVDHEMEFWSENHYIMFASSEYLLGQLWSDETFQPCSLIATAGDATGRRAGAARRDRGRARVLKWLNNRLMFGWMEFNSSGYYVEHLWALLNLVDFALDEEVRTKATMAVDLMLFDVVRFVHRGSMGAAGGRSQFKSKSCGFDNGLSDVVELMLGVKGVFAEGNAEIAASFASSTYVVPQVLLEIGANPPSYPFTDRSRVSITFEESGKYDITWSQHSTVRDSLRAGYASKRARYSPFLAEVNAEIARVHDDYGAREDDTVFFWGMSAFLNKQVVRNTAHVVKEFGLGKADAFSTPGTLVNLVGFFRAPESVLTGFSVADLPERALGALSGEGSDEVDEKAADDLSLVLEGSTRSRANILTYCSPGAMQSSIQNFRYGQLNFQSSVQQATLNGALNVFVSAGFGGLDISDLAAFGAGFLAGALVGGLLGPIGAAAGPIVGGIAAVAEVESLRGTNPLSKNHEDGPEWWTGYWALPRVLAHRGAVIMLSEFYDIQDFLAETGSHAWFPKSGFDRVVERRTSAYDDANFPLLDIGHIGPKGFWLFGKVVHPAPPGSPEPPEEGYVGVFSDKRPAWLTRDDDPYPYRMKEATGDDTGKRRWKDAADPFVDRDWYVNGKNIWIVQVGSRSEFGSFEAFMDRVSSARVHADDTGDLECTYDVPVPGGGSDRLRLTNGDSPEFELNGKPLATDLFPRFENPFVRSGRVEWGQRTYCLDWNGASLLHDFSDAHHPVRVEAPPVEPGDAETVVALVLHLRTTDQEMEAFTVLTATVDIGCRRATGDQVVAAGPVAEDTDHDAEWVFFDLTLSRSPDMVLELTHPVGGGNLTDLSFLDPKQALEPARLLNPAAGPLGLLAGTGDPAWHGTFSLRALMGDHRLLDASVAFPNLALEDERRASGKRAFTLPLKQWAPWAAVGGALGPASWLLGGHPPAASLWQDHHDLFSRDTQHRVWHRRMSCGGTVGFWRELDTAGAAPGRQAELESWDAVTDPAGRACVFVISDGALLARAGDPDGGWSQPWSDLAPTAFAGLPPFGPVPVPVPLGPGSTVTAVPTAGPFSGSADLHVKGSDGNVYVRLGWAPGDTSAWDRLESVGFVPEARERVRAVGRQLVALSTDGRLWTRDRELTVLFGGGWQSLDGPGFVVEHVAACGGDDRQLLAVRGPGGRVSVGVRTSDAAVTWASTSAADGWTPGARTDLAWSVIGADEQWLFATGTGGTVRSLRATAPLWTVVGGGAPHAAAAGSLLAATSRAPGQVEVFAQDPDGSLVWTWWS